MVSRPDFGSGGSGFESCWRRNSAHECMGLYCTKPCIMPFPSSQYDLNNIGRDVKHQIIIVDSPGIYFLPNRDSNTVMTFCDHDLHFMLH